MFEQTPRWCPCGCDTNYTIECEGDVAPGQGVWLHYSCPGSHERLSFRNSGPWASSHKAWKHKVVKATLEM